MPSHYRNQCWLVLNSNFEANFSENRIKLKYWYQKWIIELKTCFVFCKMAANYSISYVLTHRGLNNCLPFCRRHIPICKDRESSGWSFCHTHRPDHILMIALNSRWGSRIRKHLRNQYEDSITPSTNKQHFAWQSALCKLGIFWVEMNGFLYIYLCLPLNSNFNECDAI